MNPATMFDSTKESLQDLLNSIRIGRTQLPDFQRSWVWDDAHIRSLLASVSLTYPIGAVMMLQTGNPAVRFRPRPVEGVTLAVQVEPERLILDGQQRLTSLYQALLLGRPVATKDARGKMVCRWYYLDIDKALAPDGDRDDAIVSAPEDKVFRTFRSEPIPGRDLSSTEKECAAGMLPLGLVFDPAGLQAWQMAYFQADPAQMQARMGRWVELFQQVIQRYQQYQIPLIILRKETPKEAVCQVFEKVNTGGVSLTVFELLTATFAADDFNLREDWVGREAKLRLRPALKPVANTDFLQAVALLATWERRARVLAGGTPTADAPGIGCKRRDVLGLTPADYTRWADAVAAGFEAAAKFLASLRIYDGRDVPYTTQFVPLAAILAALGERADNDGVRAKLARWYWCGVFGELYGGTTESRFAKDLPEVLGWLDNGADPSTVTEAIFSPARLLTLRTRNSAAYKGLHALLMRDGALDFRTGDPIDINLYFDEKIDIHHIFPQAWCNSNNIGKARRDSVVNKAPLSARTNRIIGGAAPSAYLGRLQQNAGIDQARMDEILRSHQIDAPALRADEFDRFFQDRAQALLDRIERAMGKAVARWVVGTEAEASDEEAAEPEPL